MVGGGTSADVVFSPQTFPNAARPNNVLAPLWTDLNTRARVPGNNAIQVERPHRRRQHLDRRRLAGDQELLQRDDAQRSRSGSASRAAPATRARRARSLLGLLVRHGRTPAAGDPGSAINWGAENRDGTSGKNIASAPANGSEYRPVLSAPTAGGSVAIPYDITSKKKGSWNSVASMTSNRTPGITQVVTTLTVTP